jgi:hypothetical protein
MASSPAQSAVGLKERFFRDFQRDLAGEYPSTGSYVETHQTELQAAMERLDIAPAGSERSEAVDNCLGGINRLSHEVKDASSYLPAYDQRMYSQVDFAIFLLPSIFA